MDPDLDALDKLQDELEDGQDWPPKRERQIHQEISLWRAMYHGDVGVLKSYVDWPDKQDYVCDPLARRISDAFSDLIFGADPTFTAADDADQDNLMAIVEENDLPSELQRAAGLVNSEGEGWYRIIVDPDQASVPVIEWHSRLNVVPLFEGKTAVAVAFVSELSRPDSVAEDKSQVWRYIEFQARGVVRNALYKGTRDKLGAEQDLAAHPDLEDLADNPEWNHGLDVMLAGRVVNAFGETHASGRSEYSAVRDLLLALNEATSIGQANARLTAKKRVVVPDTYFDQLGKTPLGDDIIVRSSAHQDPDKPDAGFAQLEWEFDAEALIAYKRDLINTIITRVGLTATYVDANSDDGTADSGTALRLRLLPASLSATGRARWWDDALPKVLLAAALVDNLEEANGGIGSTWQNVETAPNVERSDPLPHDPVETATLVTTLQREGLLSKKTSLEMLFPDWDETRLEDELKRIKEEKEEAEKAFWESNGQDPNDPSGGGPPGFIPAPTPDLAETG